MNSIHTAPLLADAYPARQWKGGDRQFLTHSVVFDERREPVRVLCGKVQIESVCANDPAQITDNEPTCKVCAAKLKKLRAIHGPGPT